MLHSMEQGGRSVRRSWCGLVIVLATACGRQQPAPDAPGSDGRQRLDVPVEAQEAIRTEMRTMLASLNELLAAGARGDTAAMRAAATRSGVAAAADSALEELLPREFLELGVGTHRQFDELGAALPLPADSVLARLGRLTANCVACHATYRLSGGP